MRIVIKPSTDQYIDQIWGAVSKFLQLSKEKNPKLPRMEIILDNDQTGDLPCQHEFVVEDLSGRLAMIRCSICKTIYHAKVL